MGVNSTPAHTGQTTREMASLIAIGANLKISRVRSLILVLNELTTQAGVAPVLTACSRFLHRLTQREYCSGVTRAQLTEVTGIKGNQEPGLQPFCKIPISLIAPQARVLSANA